MVEDGDRIVIDAEKKTIEWLVDDDEQARRKAAWDASDKSKLKVKRGVLYRYARDVTVCPIHFSIALCSYRKWQSAEVGAYCD